MLRPRPTTWFELLVGRGQYALAMQKLAASGAAQLEGRPLAQNEPILPKLDAFFAAFHDLEAKYARSGRRPAAMPGWCWKTRLPYSTKPSRASKAGPRRPNL